MSRPRHREKSSLLWKMLGVAAAINLVLWPVLVREGLFAGIRREVLVPVTLISLPPAHKPPDALRRVARVPPTQRPIKAAPASVPRRPLTRPVPLAPVAVAVVPPRAKIIPPASERKPILAKELVRPQVALKTPAVVVPPAEKRLPAPRVVSVPPPAHAPPPFKVMLAARVARAKELEAQGHQVAEWIAQQRTPVVDRPPSVVASVPPRVIETKTAPAAAPKTPSVGREARWSASRFTPALAVWKTYPAVPDVMMKSAWHATFHGLFTVRQDGNVAVRMVSSTGFPVLDRRALAAARRWKFRAARKNGAAVVSRQPFVFEYDVHPVR